MSKFGKPSAKANRLIAALIRWSAEREMSGSYDPDVRPRIHRKFDKAREALGAYIFRLETDKARAEDDATGQ